MESIRIFDIQMAVPESLAGQVVSSSALIECLTGQYQRSWSTRTDSLPSPLEPIRCMEMLRGDCQTDRCAARSAKCLDVTQLGSFDERGNNRRPIRAADIGIDHAVQQEKLRFSFWSSPGTSSAAATSYASHRSTSRRNLPRLARFFD